eukprot:jgi/Mesvir1/14487/Mv05190-RA.2
MADTSPFFKGSVQEAIQLARSQALVLLVVVEDAGEESARLDAACWTDATLRAELPQACISLQLRDGTSEASNFKALFPVAQLPSLFLISCYGGVLHSSVGYIAPEELLATVRSVSAAFQQQIATASLLAAQLMATGNLPTDTAPNANSATPSALLGAAASGQPGQPAPPGQPGQQGQTGQVGQPGQVSTRGGGSGATDMATSSSDVDSNSLPPPSHPQQGRMTHASTTNAAAIPAATPAAAATAAAAAAGPSSHTAQNTPGTQARSAGQERGASATVAPSVTTTAASPIAQASQPCSIPTGASSQPAASKLPAPASTPSIPLGPSSTAGASPTLPPPLTAGTAAGEPSSALRNRKPSSGPGGASVAPDGGKGDDAAATGGSAGEKRRAEEVTEVHIRFRLLDGTSLTKDFPVGRPASDMLAFLQSENVAGGAACQLAIQYPRKVLMEQDLRQSFAQLGLVPSAAVVVERSHAAPSGIGALTSRATAPGRGAAHGAQGALGGALVGIMAALWKLWAYLVSAFSLSRFFGRPGGPGAAVGGGGAPRGLGGRVPPRMGMAAAAGGVPSSAAAAGAAAGAGGASRAQAARPATGSSAPGASSASLAAQREQRLRRFNQQPGGNVHSLSSMPERKPPSDPSNNSYWNGNSIEFGGDEDGDAQ